MRSVPWERNARERGTPTYLVGIVHFSFEIKLKIIHLPDQHCICMLIEVPVICSVIKNKKNA